MEELYNAEYYQNCCGCDDYVHNQDMIRLFQDVAKIITVNFKPKRVLDAGCACGHLVAALRDCGVEAYGVDVSTYGISQVRDDIRPFCRVASLSDPLPNDLPQRYDLVLSIEVLEHMAEDLAKIAIGNLCCYSDNILFSSTPNDEVEPTHINLHPLDYWLEQFAQHGFHCNFGLSGQILNPQSLFLSNKITPEESQRSLIQRYFQLTAQNQSYSRVTRAIVHDLDTLAKELPHSLVRKTLAKTLDRVR